MGRQAERAGIRRGLLMAGVLCVVTVHIGFQAGGRWTDLLRLGRV